MVRGGPIFTFRLMVRGGPPVDVPSGKGFQFAQIYYIKLTFNSFYALLYQPKKWAASRDNFSGTDGSCIELHRVAPSTTELLYF